MKKTLLVLMTFLLVSCNASILMTNGEVVRPESGAGSNEVESERVFSGAAPASVNATKSYYTSSIVVRWSAVEGADYYTIEKASGSSEWKQLEVSVMNTQYTDTDNLEVGVYYRYRVTAHTFEGKKGSVSAEATGTILSSPLTISASKGTSISSIELEWEQMPNVESYRIYRSSNSSVAGLESEYVATIQADATSLKLGYSYPIDEGKEAGKELYFAIEGIGPTGNAATISLPRSGYTFVPGSPSTPSISSITKGDGKDGVSIRFRSAGDDVKYIIKRYSPGASEMVIFSEEYGSVLPEADGDGYYTYTDTDVKENTLYTYSVIAYNSIGSSPACVKTGYILSRVPSVTITPLNDSEKGIGYEVMFTEPVGAGDEERSDRYAYSVNVYSKNGDILDTYTMNEGEVSGRFYGVGTSVTKESELGEIWYADVTVSLGGLSSASCSSDRIAFLPESITSISATRNALPSEGQVANANGVYPVTVIWESAFEGERVITRTGSDGSEKRIRVPGGKSYIDTTGDVLVIYDYFIDTSDAFGRTLGSIMHTGDAYGAVTPETFIDIYESVSMRPWDKQTYVPAQYRQYWKKCNLAVMVGYGNSSDLSTQMKALGSADEKDHFRNGQLHYKAEMEGVGGAIYFTYENFGECGNFSTTGSYEMHVNASGTGSASSSTGGFVINGMYPAKVRLDNISVSGKAFTGSYILEYSYSGETKEYEVRVK